MGINRAFDPQQADFSGIAPKLFVSVALQKAYVEVKEEGTEAAAVTGTDLVNAMPELPPKTQFEMIVDRPFFFLIEDEFTETILFMGAVFDPLAN